VNLDFADLAIGGIPAASAKPHPQRGQNGFGNVLHDALSQSEGSKNDAAVDRRGPNRASDEPDTNGADVEKDRDDDVAPKPDVVNLSATADLVRPMPVPPPPADEAAMGGNASGGQNQNVTGDLSEALDALGEPTNGGAAATTAQTDEAARRARLFSQQDRLRHRSNERNLADIDSELANNLTAKLEQLVNGAESGSENAIDTGKTEAEWRRAMLAKLTGMVESFPSERSIHPRPSRSPIPQTPSAPDIGRVLASMANQASTENSSPAKSFGASGIVELLQADRFSGFDRHASQLNLLRIEPSMLAPLRAEIESASLEFAAIAEPTIDTDLPEQIVQSIRVQALDLGGEARVRLRPSYLGEVVVSVKVDAGTVTATLQADTPAVRRWIETHEASLRIGLADHGLHLDRLIVSEPSKSESEPGERRRQSPQDQPARHAPRRSAPNEEEAGTFEVVV
jgi:flagellar hook-length control protein FliK